MKQIKINSESYQLKSSFTEITTDEFLKICILRSQFIQKEASLVEFNAVRLPIFRILSNIPDAVFNKITAEQWADLLPHIDFAAIETPDFDKNLMPFVNIDGKIYHGPIGLMDKCTAEEFTYIDTAFVRASNAKDTSALVQMFAFMYRPQRIDLDLFKASASWNGDVREEFNSEKCKSRIEYFTKVVPVHFLVANYLYFKCVHVNRYQKLKYLFEKTSSKIFMDDRGWAGSMLSLSHTGVFGNFAEQMKMNWFTVMVEMDRLAEQTIKSQENK